MNFDDRRRTAGAERAEIDAFIDHSRSHDRVIRGAHNRVSQRLVRRFGSGQGLPYSRPRDCDGGFVLIDPGQSDESTGFQRLHALMGSFGLHSLGVRQVDRRQAGVLARLEQIHRLRQR